MHPDDITPVEPAGVFWVKREDLCGAGLFLGGVGGKLRQAWATAQARPGPLIGYGGRRSNTAGAFAAVARFVGRPAVFHTAAGEDTEEMEQAERCGAEVRRHRPGYLALLRARAVEHGRTLGVAVGPDETAVIAAVARQCEALRGIPYRRVVLAAGSGLTVAGVAAGLYRLNLPGTVVAVTVGGCIPLKLFALHRIPTSRISWIESGTPYDKPSSYVLDGRPLDPLYEAKAAVHLEPGDLLWDHGSRAG